MRVIRADVTAQLRLLDLQGVDSALAQLEHRRRTLPEHAELAALDKERSVAGAGLVEADTQVSDLELDQERAESDLEPVRQRLTRNEKRIADGTVGDPKALSSMVEEVAHLRRRISDLEDAELEVMEALDTATTARDAARQRVADLDAQATALVERRDARLAELAQQAQGRRTEREQVLPDVPADLLALYTKLGASHNGVGAAELRQRRCTGCQLEVNAAELRDYAAAAPEEVLRCEECGRILVRTAESGL